MILLGLLSLLTGIPAVLMFVLLMVVCYGEGGFFNQVLCFLCLVVLIAIILTILGL